MTVNHGPRILLKNDQKTYFVDGRIHICSSCDNMEKNDIFLEAIACFLQILSFDLMDHCLKWIHYLSHLESGQRQTSRYKGVCIGLKKAKYSCIGACLSHNWQIIFLK